MNTDYDSEQAKVAVPFTAMQGVFGWTEFLLFMLENTVHDGML